MKLISVFLFSLGLGWAQTPSCSWKDTFTTATANPGHANNSSNPNCNAFALTWNSTGFTVVSIQLEGSNDNVTFTAFSGSSTVLAGTSNPTSALSGAIIVQAQTKLAYIRVKVNSVTGSGSISAQIFGYNGVTAAASAATSGAGTSWANVTAGTNAHGFLQVHSPTVIEPTAIAGGGIYATQMVDANDLPAVTITTPGGPAIDILNIATSAGGGGATVTARASGPDANINLLLAAQGAGTLQLGSANGFIDAAGNLTVLSCTGCASATTSFAALSTGSNTTATMTVSTGASLLPGGTGTIQANRIGSSPVATVSSLDASTKLMSSQAAAYTNGDCVFVLNGDLTDFGGPCGNMRTSINNTGAVGFGMDASASTVANAVRVPVQAGLTATANGAIGYDATNNNFHGGAGNADSVIPVTTVTPANGNCVEWLVSGNTIKVGDTGSACGAGGGGGGGVIAYSSSADTLLATRFFAPGGGAPAAATESDVQVASPATATISNLHVQISSALGIGSSAVFTWRDAGVSTSSTCTISGAVAVSCSDTSHSFTAAAGDLLDMQVVTTGTPSAVNVLFTSAFGTSNVGTTSVSFTGGLISVATPTTTPALTVAGTSGGVPYFSGAATWASSAALTAHGVVVGGGTGTAPTSTAVGTAGQVLTSNGAGVDPTFQATSAAYYPFPAITTPPSTGGGGWTAVNCASCTFTTQSNGDITLFDAADAVNNLHLQCRAAPATPWTLTINYTPNLIGVNFTDSGLVMRESATGKILEHSMQSNGAGPGVMALTVNTWDSATGTQTNIAASTADVWYTPFAFQKAGDNGTNNLLQQSSDGNTYNSFYNIARTTAFTTKADQICLSVNPRNPTYGAGMTVHSWAGVP